jgi:hypothetical protein
MPIVALPALKGVAAVSGVVELLLRAIVWDANWPAVRNEQSILLERIPYEDEILRNVLYSFFSLYDDNAFLADDLHYLESHSKEELLVSLQAAHDLQEHATILRELLVDGRIKGYAETTAATFRAGELLLIWRGLNPTMSVVGPALRSLEHSNTYGLMAGPYEIEAITRTLSTLALAP